MDTGILASTTLCSPAHTLRQKEFVVFFGVFFGSQKGEEKKNKRRLTRPAAMARDDSLPSHLSPALTLPVRSTMGLGAHQICRYICIDLHHFHRLA